MTDILGQQTQAQQAQAQQAQAQQVQAQVSVPVSTGESSDSSDGVNSEIGKLRAEKDQYERIIKTEISKFESDLIGVCSNYGIVLPSELEDYNSKIDERKIDGFCIADGKGKHLSRYENNKALQYIKTIKTEIMGTEGGKLLFETHKNKNLYGEILDFAIICLYHRVTVDNYVRLLRIIKEYPEKKLSDYISKFTGINIRGQSMINILNLAEGLVKTKIEGDRVKYTKMFEEEDLNIDYYFPVAISA